ncbi:MAG: 3-deoxy-manno-octulosonate cytidylyltransferase [Planctomycetia bacterium]|jgi:3-deoxy-manno-octulosonate cytidylyltransferase (CMP-KDO synthetase)
MTRPAQVLIVIPARLSSSRLPRKMLLADTGHPLVEHTWRAARRSRTAGNVVVATDSTEIADAVRGFGGAAVMTSPACTSGTARIVEALDRLPEAEIVVNVQGDEPELAGTAIDTAVALLDRCPEAGVATLVTPLRREEDLHDPAAVKGVLTPWRDAAGRIVPDAWRAITFSRAPVPAAREWTADLLTATPPFYWQHVGLYAYRRGVLQSWDALPPSRLAELESLEQLRLVEAGVPIVAGVVEHAARGIDTPRDYAAFVARWRSGG